MTLWGLQVGSIAELVAAIAALASTILSIVALTIARAANATSEAARHESQKAAAEAAELERNRDARFEDQAKEARAQSEKALALEATRDRRLMAQSLQAWWAKSGTDAFEQDKTKKDTWGVILSNEGPGASVFYDVEITTTGKYRIMMASLPPGRYFVKSRSGPPYGWDLPVHVDPVGSPYIAITLGTKHRVHAIAFSDAMGMRWNWKPETGVVHDGVQQTPGAANS